MRIMKTLFRSKCIPPLARLSGFKNLSLVMYAHHICIRQPTSLNSRKSPKLQLSRSLSSSRSRGSRMCCPPRCSSMVNHRKNKKLTSNCDKVLTTSKRCSTETPPPPTNVRSSKSLPTTPRWVRPEIHPSNRYDSRHKAPWV